MTTTATDIARVLDAVKSIVPQLRENGLEGERRRWIAEENIDLLEKAEVYRTGVPQRFGGLDLTVVDHIKILLEIARGCGSTGWVSEGYITAAWMIRLYPERTQREVYADGSVRVSGGFTPSGKIERVEGGYVLDGSWRFNTGCRGAHWNLAVSTLTNPDGTTEQLMAVVPIQEFGIADDWEVMAAAGTGSATVTAREVFVPEHRVVNMADAFAWPGDPAGDQPTGRDYGLISLVMAESTAVIVGLARGVYEMFVERAPGKPISYTAWEDQARHPLVHVQVGTAANKIAAAEALLANQAALMQRRADAGERLTLVERATLRGQCGYAVQLAREAASELFAASGASAIALAMPIQRFFRDIQGISMHAVMTPNANLELYGRVLLGLDPETPFL
ncbi:acyl-CoA dehydrogenase family protein [Actinokineospora iranica]|uniref:Acyl-CoA dehydrogenase n=1 Tax=Actinokineospora iranica TaxID=1271860 RepID=A0A1G6RYE8_9PSEU|nr:acyl-CoA dehydrogenase family protein [Actinokineospora iranica]SDD09608.1 Acyl-CoA dehydrogenase [Actinokineospora iranica]